MTAFNNISVEVHPRVRGERYVNDAVASITARIDELKARCAGVYTEEDIKKLDSLKDSFNYYTGRNRWSVVTEKNRDYDRKPRVYVFLNDEGVYDNLMNRHARPYQLWKTEVLPQVLALAGLTGVSARWSQKAGCSCPCSPGFILDDDGHFDIYVTVNGPRNTDVADTPELRWLDMA